MISNYGSREILVKIDNQILYRLDLSVIKIGDKIINEFDIIKFFKRSYIHNPDVIDIKLSPSDLKFYQLQRKKLSSKVYINNNEKKWKKAKIIIDGKKSNIKIKLHGSSTSYIKENKLSFKIKHPKKGPYFGLFRQYNLLNYGKEGKVSTIAINNMANNFGLITSPEKTVILKVNDIYYGLFRLEESLGKDYLFERNYQLPNFSIIRTSDNYDRKFYGEVSNLELDEKFYVIDGSSTELNQIAIGALKEMLNSIKEKDINKIKELIDIDYYAKFFAFISLYNQGEYGSDMKLLFDHDSGKFKIIFRSERNSLGRYDNVSYLPQFNTKLIDDWKSGTFEIFKILLLDKEFIKKRDVYLIEIVKNKNNFKKIINQAYNENEKNIIHSKEPRTLEKYLKTKLLKDLNENINIIGEYLDYGNFYISVETKMQDKQNKKMFTILNDSFVEHYIEGYYNQASEFIAFDEKIILKGTKDFFKIKLGEYPNDKQTTIELKKKEEVLSFKIVNSLNKKEIVKEKQFYNKIKDTSKKINFLEIMKKFQIDYIIDDNNFYILKGKYFINEDIIFPENLNVTFNKGVHLILGKKTNILIRGSFSAIGSIDNKIIVTSQDIVNKKMSFGSVVIIGDPLKDSVELDYFDLSGGSDTNISFIKTTSQMHINNFKDISIENSYFHHSISDDGLNIKNSKVKISGSKFINNFADQLDLDNCYGEVSTNIFIPDNIINNKDGDGLDISHSKLIIRDNTFEGNHDKGLSVGENSEVSIEKNIIIKNNIGIAIKDGSKAYFGENHFSENINNIKKYNKKFFYNKPVIIEKNF